MSMQNNTFYINQILATGGYYVGPAGNYNKTHSAPYSGETEWTAFTPTSTTGAISSSTNCRYKVMGNVCVVNLVFNYAGIGGGAVINLAGLPFNCKSQVYNTIVNAYDNTAATGLNDARLLTTVNAKTFTITSASGDYIAGHSITIRGQLMYKIVEDGESVVFNGANTFYGNIINGNNFYFPGARVNIEDRLFYIKSNAAADTLVAGANMTSLDTNNSFYRITNNTVMFWLAIVFTKNGVAADTVTITGLPYNALLTAAADCDINRVDIFNIIGGAASFSSGTITIINSTSNFTNSAQYRVFCFIQYQLEP